jgi:hypothetical protein
VVICRTRGCNRFDRAVGGAAVICRTRGCGPAVGRNHPPNAKATYLNRIVDTTSAGRRAGRHRVEHD